MQNLSHVARAFGFSIYGNQSAGRLSPENYVASYAFWSFAKAAPYSKRTPEQIDFLVSSQRLPLDEAPPQAESDKARRLFPWGNILKSILDELEECDPEWLYTLLFDLRTYTIENLDGLCAELMLKRTSGIHTSFAKAEWLDRVMQSFEQFAALGLLQSVQQAISKSDPL